MEENHNTDDALTLDELHSNHSFGEHPCEAVAEQEESVSHDVWRACHGGDVVKWRAARSHFGRPPVRSDGRDDPLRGGGTMIDAPPGFVWEQPDAMKLRCTDCGESVEAGVVDLHTC